MKETIQNGQLANILFASVHFSDGTCYPIVNEDLYRAQNTLPKLSGFCFLVINQIDGEIKIIKKV
ncbi:hypothetical protein KDU71_02830 [Carboxylicivirga sediminis]|uniref:Uncharacterized protein n=1 Tax=Carboxylicivirga sediminis TaxID=2006564 RepID=A0A941IV37_9BACT|nr:hypothetical protein [Carboxylicivirga sediminis]MBR8534480.1 hypothetical protein [Carboxylicivirga sediminis]